MRMSVNLQLADESNQLKTRSFTRLLQNIVTEIDFRIQSNQHFMYT
jgi:hypothetical protein